MRSSGPMGFASVGLTGQRHASWENMAHRPQEENQIVFVLPQSVLILCCLLSGSLRHSVPACHQQHGKTPAASLEANTYCPVARMPQTPTRRIQKPGRH